LGDILEHLGVDAKPLIAHQRFTTKFEQDAFVAQYHGGSHPSQLPTARRAVAASK
jgi:hypothetical protein